MFFGYSVQFWPEESYQNSMNNWLPSAEKIETEINSMRGGWLEQMDKRIGMAIFMQTFLFLIEVFWRVTALMLLGMALFKWGVLSAKKSRAFYFRLSVLGILAGYMISGIGIYQNFSHEWSLEYSMFYGNQFNYIASISTAMGYIGLVMLLCKSVCCDRFKKLMAVVGRMAFTNYILMSLLAMIVFYGNGFGLFGFVKRWEQSIFVVAIWIIILIISPWWLKNFRYGPLEWLWRVLTYWKYQPIKK
jgi:uncharacterized protein